MNFARTILGPVVTEKAERLKAQPKHTYTLFVNKNATKVDVRAAIEHFYDVKVEKVRVMKTKSKSRPFGNAQTMQKRASMKKVLVTLTKKSKALDLTTFMNQ
ncbi:MAG: 50S ribosomal protein L23 [Candidatus Peribacteraceae bacterium]|nr:50S ribosomal protein L23 [Candidatus Peribacteraceae bacterium]MDD5074930.1 50S ribosomal protein L23 [Candidatus Peribacteraceae bacterium]